MTLNIEEISFQIILNGGNARSLAAESINHAKAGEFALAEQKIEEANEAMTIAHRFQTNLIKGEASGEKLEISILLIHAQDHLMNAVTDDPKWQEIDGVICPKIDGIFVN
ncbi:PTS lactose/cellobiose transporter subunit IIA [Weizmannia sp. FSL W8-0401]|uniref:PTS lactose/cellobiose transporter subunit IIA n=1 Tax=Weizmannia sp. FSL W8-0401 TaxID=2954554 RepID=UPI0030F624CE